MKQRNEAKPFEILLVEDNPGDVRLTTEALEENSRNIKLYIIENGREVLVEIKKDINLKQIPVVVLTISSAEDDIVNAYENHANCYITKPLNLDQFFKKILNIIEFWSLNVRYP